MIGKSNIRDFEVSLQAKAVGGNFFAEADELFGTLVGSMLNTIRGMSTIG